MKLDLRDLQFPDTTSYRCFAQAFAISPITAAPNSLPAKRPAYDAYVGMFATSEISDASNLKFGFEDVDNGACYSMFSDCVSMTKAPFIPSVSAGAYNSLAIMFRDCHKLSEISVGFTSWPYDTQAWLNGVSANGVFYCPYDLGRDENIQRGSSGCPYNWLVANWDFSESAAREMNNCFTRGSYTTIYLQDGQSHVPDVSGIKVYNRKTAKQLVSGVDYGVGTPEGQDNTTPGNKSVYLSGTDAPDGYYGNLALTYTIASNSITAC